jgi:ketosteroid isomerase-like protein
MDENHRTFDSWLQAYGSAWENKDPAAAAGLFSEDATYRETPFDEPAHGREAIAEYWARVTAGQEGIRFGHEVLMVADDMGIARWWASFLSIRSGNHVEVDGIFVIRMDAGGRCEEFREWWHSRERDPEKG